MRTSIATIIAIGALSVAGAQAADLAEVTVSSPTVKTTVRDATGTPIRQLSGTVRLQYDPIMLTTNSGRALLDDKVSDVARNLCSANGAFPNADDDWNCVQQAVQTAKVQLDAATAQVRVSVAQEEYSPSSDD
jgi:UrcA family protein